MDLDRLVAIDVHTHVHVSVHGGEYAEDSPEKAVGKVFGSDALLSVPELAAYYRERNMACVAFMVDSVRWGAPVTNEEILELAAAERDTMIPFASIDPHRGAEAAATARRLIDEFDVRGFKFHPSLQGFEPNDPRYHPLYEAMSELGVPALFHTGQTGIGAGLPGGRGIKLRYSAPMLLDDVAADFPQLTIIMAHPSVPWQDEAISIATHKSNVYIDLSGWSPKYFPPQLVRAANSLLRHKVLFGSDFPVITPDRWLADFAKLELKDDVRPLILKDNAARVLGLSG
jgi:predicted TIM-barrel fold metal-dependent hydrolase